MLTRYPIGMAATALALVLAGRRIYFIGRLIGSGRPDTERKMTFGRGAKRELTEVVGQRRLLAWTVPGLAHAFTFWGFNVLLFTIIEAWGDLFSKSFAIPGIGHAAALGFLEDTFGVCVLLALATFATIRLVRSPRRISRESRFFGSHTGTAWLVLGMIASVMITLFVYRAAQTNTGDFPYGQWAFASHALGRLLHPAGIAANRTIETVALDANVIVICAFLVIVAYSKHLHIFLAPLNIAFSP